MQDLNEDYWTKRYQEHKIGWDMGVPSPQLLHFMENQNEVGRNDRILIPGAGNAHEWVHFVQKGYEQVYAMDISPFPLNTLASRNPEHAHLLLHEDFFRHDAKYDLILEQTFFCALDPSMRSTYVEHTHRLLKKGGILAGVLFNRTFPHQGPPFGGNQEEYQSLFEEWFEVIHMDEAMHSHPARLGSELFIHLVAK